MTRLLGKVGANPIRHPNFSNGGNSGRRLLTASLAARAAGVLGRSRSRLEIRLDTSQASGRGRHGKV